MGKHPKKNDGIAVIHEPVLKSVTREHTNQVRSSKKLPTLKGISSVIISDEEEQPGDKDPYGSTVSQGKGKTVEPQVVDKCSSDYQRRNYKVIDTENSKIVKKLSYTPSPSPSSFKRKDRPTKQKNKLETQLRIPGSSCKFYKLDITKATLPKVAMFPPIKKMYLKPEEAILCLYLFPENVGFHLHSPMVFKIGEYCEGLRNDFECMIPDGWVGDRIITMMTATVNWNQRQTYKKEVWCLPPSFAMEVGNKATTETLLNLFRDPYLPDFAKLKLIYVPIEDHDYQHWYLMVINTEYRKVYHLDTYMVESAIAMRHAKMHSIAEALSLITLSIFDGDVPCCTYPDFHQWEIVEPRGIPNYGHSANSGLWVTEWLQLESCFNNQVIGGMDETVMRMKIVMRILMGANNDCRAMIIAAANECWFQLHVDRDNAFNLKIQKLLSQGEGESH
ncbi:Ulp1 protease family carboxy-terminal domain protein [Trifolium medium]|uniref:Ulp1 protease family carboxy-terminal domain protein n=1 Tax=Trifolium medium TaxID=97028 RepID=A0A392LZL7_9FABA|nr:Ulp1 protease family carboxy-terminal domain protein [Trifolium medium]